MLREWYKNIPETNIEILKNVREGDDAKSNRYVQELLTQAKDEGWVLNPQWANPGSQEFVEPDEEQENDMIDLIEQLNKNQDTKNVGGIAKR